MFLVTAEMTPPPPDAPKTLGPHGSRFFRSSRVRPSRPPENAFEANRSGRRGEKKPSRTCSALLCVIRVFGGSHCSDLAGNSAPGFSLRPLRSLRQGCWWSFSQVPENSFWHLNCQAPKGALLGSRFQPLRGSIAAGNRARGYVRSRTRNGDVHHSPMEPDSCRDQDTIGASARLPAVPVASGSKGLGNSFQESDYAGKFSEYH